MPEGDRLTLTPTSFSAPAESQFVSVRYRSLHSSPLLPTPLSFPGKLAGPAFESRQLTEP